MAEELGLNDRMETLARNEAFLTLKDHKENFASALPCRLLNPSKSEMGVVSKRILDNIVSTLRGRTTINLWKNTAGVLEWFRGINEKTNCKFISFDIVEFYPSISEKLLGEALDFAQQHVKISTRDIEIIFHARKSLLFRDGRAWMKREKESPFDVAMGSYDGAEVCELVGAFLLNRLTASKACHSDEAGLYRDDGLAVTRNASGHETDATRKRIIGIFKEHGLRITIEINLPTVNFLDTTLDLRTGKYHPYRKPNDRPLYVHRLSNHPPQILKNLPNAIGKRLSEISSDEDIFSEAATPYEEALRESGFTGDLHFTEHSPHAQKKPTRKRCRNILWFNPPFSKNVRTNVGRRFLQLVCKHFPKSSRLSKIFNRNTLKVSYSCMPNVAAVIASSNKRLTNNRNMNTGAKPCNCRDKRNCPLNGLCQSRSIVYKAQVISTETGMTKEYIGLTEPPFKQRLANHTMSFKHEKYENRTELSKYAWSLKRRGEDFNIRWSILQKTQAYSNISKRCNLCLAEKVQIIMADKEKRLNARCELVSTCRHARKFSLDMFTPVT